MHRETSSIISSQLISQKSTKEQRTEDPLVFPSNVHDFEIEFFCGKTQATC